MTHIHSEPYRLHFRPDGDVLAAARACEAEVFLNTYGNTAEQWAEEYGPYEHASHFIALADTEDQVVGVIRLIAPSEAGLKTVNDVSRPPWNVDGDRAVRAAGADLPETWDIATLAVRPDRRLGGLAAAALYHGVFMAINANNIAWMTMMLDERARRLLAMAAIVPRLIPGTAPGPYLGSPTSAPLLGEIAAMSDYQRRTNPEAHRLISLGIGLTGIAVPPLADFVVDVPAKLTVPATDAPSFGVARELAQIA